MVSHLDSNSEESNESKLRELRGLINQEGQNATSKLSNDEKRRLLKPEVLAGLTTAEYLALWQKINRFYVSHVTRQGFRDHASMTYHTGGMRDFHEGFTSIISDQKIIRPPIAVREGLRSRTPDSIRIYLMESVLKATEAREAIERLDTQLNESDVAAPKYPDKTAVHFAAEIVADSYYGAEKGNEVFIVYPTDILASQHNFAFNGWQKDFTKPQDEAKWNDVFFWPNNLDNAGIPLDSGIVFLPEETPVDPVTGSKYASTAGEDNQLKLIEEDRLIEIFTSWTEQLTADSCIVQLHKAYENAGWQLRNETRQQTLDAIAEEMQQLGFTKDAADDLSLVVFENLRAFQSTQKLGWGDFSAREIAKQRLLEANAIFKRPERTVTAKEYWQAYFARFPEKRPKHIIYYKGNPTAAVKEFLQENGITGEPENPEDKLLGFGDKHVEDLNNDPRAYHGYSELVRQSVEKISDHFGVEINI